MIWPRYRPSAAVTLAGLMCWIMDAADYLASQGYVYDADDPDLDAAIALAARPEIAGQLANLTASCGECRIHPMNLTAHWLDDEQERYIRQLPGWTCACGARYKLITGSCAAPREFYYPVEGLRGPVCAAADDPADGGDCLHESCPEILFGCGGALLGTRAGQVKINNRQKVTSSDACPACGRLFAETITRRQVPEGALF